MGGQYQLLVRKREKYQQTALVENGCLLEYYEESAEDAVVGSVFLGRVERVLPDVKAAFVKIGLKQNGFLPLKEAESYHQTCGKSALLSGQDIIVQAKKAPKGEKGAFLTRDIALPGQYMLLMPCNRFIGMSKRIENESDRERAKKLGRQTAAERFGMIIRHAALFASEKEVADEAEALWKLWQDIVRKAQFCKAPALMCRETGMAEVLKRDYQARHEIAQHEDELLWDSLRIDEQAHEALLRRVELPGGGSLIIDEREALQTIDVNSGSAVKAENGMSLALAENLHAVGEIARQIRLRNLSGIILIDFIDMDSEAERLKVLQAMENAVADDRVKNVIHGFTKLGLLEMTRKRTGESLRDQLTQPCTQCKETGRVMRDGGKEK